MNKAYEVEEDRPFVPKTALAVGLTLLATIGLLVAFVTIVGASHPDTGISSQLGLDQAAVDGVSLARWPSSSSSSPSRSACSTSSPRTRRIPFRWCLAGGALFAVGWLVATGVFGLYVANFANYANTYGALGGVIVLMLWFYLSALILVGAAALIAVILKETRPGGRPAAAGDGGRAGRTCRAEAAPAAPVPALAVSRIGVRPPAPRAASTDGAARPPATAVDAGGLGARCGRRDGGRVAGRRRRLARRRSESRRGLTGVR